MLVRSSESGLNGARPSADRTTMRRMTSTTTARGRQALRRRVDREELAEQIARVLPRDGAAQPQAGLHFQRMSAPAGPLHGVLEPSFCVIAQGSKDILIGDETFHYDPEHYLIGTVGLPAVGHVVEASRDRPYLSFRLTLDPSVVTSVMIESAVVQ